MTTQPTGKKMEYKELIKSFAAKYGVANIIIEDDIAALKIDDVTMCFLNDSAADTLTIVADLGRHSIDADGPFGAMMLKANHLFQTTKGATLFQNPDNDSFGLQQMYRLAYMDVDTLSGEVEKLTNLAEDWTAILNGSAQVQAEYAKRNTREASTDPLDLSGDGFLRI